MPSLRNSVHDQSATASGMLKFSEAGGLGLSLSMVFTAGIVVVLSKVVAARVCVKRAKLVCGLSHGTWLSGGTHPYLLTPSRSLTS
jgi:hypothetical protein